MRLDKPLRRHMMTEKEPIEAVGMAAVVTEGVVIDTDGDGVIDGIVTNTETVIVTAVDENADGVIDSVSIETVEAIVVGVDVNSDGVLDGSIVGVNTEPIESLNFDTSIDYDSNDDYDDAA